MQELLGQRVLRVKAGQVGKGEHAETILHVSFYFHKSIYACLGKAGITVLILLVKKLRFLRFKQLAQSHLAAKGQKEYSNLDSVPSLQPVSLITCHAAPVFC